MDISLEGIWKVRLADGTEGEMRLPGTLDEAGIGFTDLGTNKWHPDAEPGDEELLRQGLIPTRFTRKHCYEGEAVLRRRLNLRLPAGKRSFLLAERARVLRLLIDGKEAAPCRPASISSPWRFEVTGLPEGEHEVSLLSDNSYPGLPHDAILYSSAATDETQTNWNGILGEFGIKIEEPVFIRGIFVYPMGEGLTVRAEIDGDRPWRGKLRLRSAALAEDVELETEGKAGISRIELAGLPLRPGVRRWDEEEGNLYELTAELAAEEKPGTFGSCDSAAAQGTFPDGPKVFDAGSFSGCSETSDQVSSIGYAKTAGGCSSALRFCSAETVTFGIRFFGDNGRGRLALNGRTVFLRGEANCAVFPETGHPPVKVEEWEDILRRYRAYGVNCMRFHSHCPPEAAFTAADRLGMLMQPELSHWNPRDAFESEESFSYYREELEGILRMLANHPSFVMLTFGNELQAGEEGHQRMRELLGLARELDPTRLYANASNPHYGSLGCDLESDFYTAQSWHELELRGCFAGMKGYINEEYPGARHHYDKAIQKLREEYEKPVFGFEVGQFEVLPDFRELEEFRGVTMPVNYELIRERVRERGLEDVWERYVEATGELSRICYREEVEAALRTAGLSGISLLGLQDFPGQGTALVGMMNSHLEPKPCDFARPERFRSFFRESLPLVLLEKYTYVRGERLQADIVMANYGKGAIDGSASYWFNLKEQDGRSEERLRGSLGEVHCPQGENTRIGRLDVLLDFGERAVRLDLTVTVCGIGNTWPLWVYPAAEVGSEPGGADSFGAPPCNTVYETESFDEETREILRAGGTVYLAPPSDQEHLPRSIRGQFTTDFWSVGTFSSQEGGMGHLIDKDHPIFKNFPTESHTNWQWWAMAGQRAVILPRPVKCIVAVMDSYAFLRPMAQLLEFRCGGGKVLFSSMGLRNLRQYPEAAALQAAIDTYLVSGEFEPAQELTPEELEEMTAGQL